MGNSIAHGAGPDYGNVFHERLRNFNIKVRKWSKYYKYDKTLFNNPKYLKI